MTPGRLNKIVTVTMSCLYAAITTATANSIVATATSLPSKSGPNPAKDEEVEGYASGIVQKSVSWCFVWRAQFP